VDPIEIRSGTTDSRAGRVTGLTGPVAVAAVSTGAVLVGIVLRGVALRRWLDLGDAASAMLLPVPLALAFSGCGAFLWGFRGARPVAKLMLVTGAITAVGVLGQGLRGWVAGPGTVVAELGSVVATIGLVVPLVLLPQVFPDGLLQGRRWTIVAWVSTGVAAGSIVAVVTIATVADGDPEWPWSAMGAAVTCGALAGVVSLIVRWQSASEMLKRQILGFALVSMIPVMLLGVSLLPGLQGLDTDWVTMFWPVAAVVAVTASAIQHDLYGIRSSVHRAAVFTAAAIALSVLFVGVYFVVIDLMTASNEAEPLRWPAVLVAATAILLLDPIRRRLTAGVKRRLLGYRSTIFPALTQLSATPAPDALVALVHTVAVGVRSPGVTLSVSDQAGSRIVAQVGDPELRCVAVPLKFQAESLGQLDVAPRTPGEPFLEGDWEMLMLLAQQAAIQLYSVRRDSDLERARQETGEREQQLRAQIGRDLHDGLAPLLAGAGLTADALRLGMVPGSMDARDASRLADQLREAISQVRRMARDLQPVVITKGLGAAIADFIDALDGPGTPPIETTVEVCEVPADLTEAAYFIVLEAINNALRHGNPSHVWVGVHQRGADLEIRVSDDGCGVTLPYAQGLGVTSMRRRATSSGGHLELLPRPGGGAELSVVLRSPA
jgi:signal transduction histidine kinase